MKKISLLPATLSLLLCLLHPGPVQGQSLPATAPPASSNLWRIDGPDGQSGYLLGTIHSEDARVLDYPPRLLEALNECDQFAMELVPNLPTLTALTGLMNYQGEERLSDSLSPALYQRVVARLGDYGMPEPMVARLRPWAVAMTLSVPPPETGMFMDFSLSLRAAAEGKKVVALETLEEQVGFLENMGLEGQLQMIHAALDEPEQMQHQYQRMIEVYLEGDPWRLWDLAFEEMSHLSPKLTEYFVAEGVDARNRRMLARLEALLAEGKVFAAVGALHLPKEMGLVQLLREKGYRLTPLSMDP